MRKKAVRLTYHEKLEIQTMVAEGKTDQEIAKILDRVPSTITKYVNEFKTLISKIDVQFQEQQDMPKNDYVSVDMYNEALKFMNMNGLTNKTARAKLNITISKLLGVPSSAEDLAKTAINQISASELMINKSSGGRSGITTMTEAASYQGDVRRNRNRGRTRKGMLYSPKTGKPL